MMASNLQGKMTGLMPNDGSALVQLRDYLARQELPADNRQYENWDKQLHRAIAEAAGNQALFCLFDTLNAIRQAIIWGRLRASPSHAPSSNHTFGEHKTIVRAIERRGRDGAAQGMRVHLGACQSVGDRAAAGWFEKLLFS